MKRYLQPTAIAILLLAGTGFATASPNATPAAQMPAPAGFANAVDRPIVLAQVQVQFGGDRDRYEMRRRHHRDEGVVIVPRRHHRDWDADRSEHRRDWDHNRD
jgi:hypothetical protein